MMRWPKLFSVHINICTFVASLVGFECLRIKILPGTALDIKGRGLQGSTYGSTFLCNHNPTTGTLLRGGATVARMPPVAGFTANTSVGVGIGDSRRRTRLIRVFTWAKTMYSPLHAEALPERCTGGYLVLPRIANQSTAKRTLEGVLCNPTTS